MNIVCCIHCQRLPFALFLILENSMRLDLLKRNILFCLNKIYVPWSEKLSNNVPLLKCCCCIWMFFFCFLLFCYEWNISVKCRQLNFSVSHLTQTWTHTHTHTQTKALNIQKQNNHSNMYDEYVCILVDPYIHTYIHT